MPRRGGISGASGDKKEDEEIAALAAITGAILDQVKRTAQINSDKQNIIQIVIYESSV